MKALLKDNNDYDHNSSKDENNKVEEPNYFLNFGYENKVNIDNTIDVLSLFSGCGGMDLGLEGGFTVHNKSINQKVSPDFIDKIIDQEYVKLKPTKFKTVFANDILKEAKTAWIHNFKKLGYNPSIFHSESIVDLVKMHKEGSQVFPDKVDIVTGGFPCQDFSVAGKRKGFDSHKDHNGKISKNEIASEETRGKLYMWMKEVIEITKPNIFIAENVKGLVNLSNVKEIIQKDFSKADDDGYIVLEPRVLHSADYGVPQSRQRVIFIGIRKSALNEKALKELSKEIISENYNPYPNPTHSYTSKRENNIEPQILKNVFSTLNEPEFSNDLSQKYFSKAKFMGKHCQGQTEINLDGISPTIRAEHHGNIEFRRLSKENGGNKDFELKKGIKERRLTPRECATIQTFPMDFEFVIAKNSDDKKNFSLSPSGAYKVIGNAVPPLLAYHIAKRIEKLWNLYFD